MAKSKYKLDDKQQSQRFKQVAQDVQTEHSDSIFRRAFRRIVPRRSRSYQHNFTPPERHPQDQ